MLGPLFGYMMALSETGLLKVQNINDIQNVINPRFVILPHFQLIQLYTFC